MSVTRIYHSILITGLALGISTPVLADPPPWAPAHGYYKNKDKKHKRHHDDDDHYAVGAEYNTRDGYPTLSCDHNGAQAGTVVGGIIGGVLGSQIGKGNGKTLATIAGTLIGAYVGNSVGANMDAGDARCAGESFEVAHDNQSVAWNNPDSRTDYTVTPVSSYKNRSGQNCRNYTSEVTIEGRRQASTGTACKDTNGEWRIAKQ